MADRNWYTGIGGRQEGPYSDEQLRALIASGRVTADTLVWATGMENWTKAGAIPGLIGNAQRPPPIPSPSATLPPGAVQSFSTDVRVWPLIGRSIVVVLAQLLILPAPWAITSFYRWFVEHLQVPAHSRVAFAGKAEDIWYIFMLNALLGYAGFINQYLPLAAFFLGPLFALIIARWFIRNLTWDGQATTLRFAATYWPLLGWYVPFRHLHLQHHRLGLGVHRLDALDVPPGRGRHAPPGVHHERLGSFVAHGAVRTVVHFHCADPVELSLVHALDGVAIRARQCEPTGGGVTHPTPSPKQLSPAGRVIDSS